MIENFISQLSRINENQLYILNYYVTAEIRKRKLAINTQETEEIELDKANHLMYLLADRKKSEAVKLIKKLSGKSLKECKFIVDGYYIK